MNRKIRVLYILSGGHLYGDNRSILQTIFANKNKVDALVCTTEKGPMTDLLQKNNVGYFIVCSALTPNLSSKRSSFRKWQGWLRRIPLACRQLSKIIRKFQPDIIHSNNSLIFSGYFLAKKNHIPHVWHVREYQTLDHHLTNRYIEKEKIWLRNSYCIGITRGIFEFWKMQSPKDVQIYNGMYSVLDLQPYVYDKKDYFLYSGRITETKGVHDMLEAFGQFCATNGTTKLFIAGGYNDNLEYKKLLDKIICKYNIQDRVKFLGFVNDMRSLMLEAKALIVPSYFEAMGRITAEAMLMGCYVIGRNTAGTKELLEREHTGLLFDDIKDLTNAMNLVALKSNKELANTNRPVMQTAKEHYSSEINALQIFEFYNRILSNEKS